MPMCPSTIRLKLWFLHPTQLHTPNGIPIGSAIYAKFTTVQNHPFIAPIASLQVVSYLTLKLPLPDGNLDSRPHLIHGFLSQPELSTKTASRSVQLFLAQLTAECSYTLQWTAFPPSKSGPPSNTWFLWPTRVFNYTTHYSDRLTERQTTLHGR